MSRSIRLETVSFRQTKGMCGPACLKIVAAYFHIDVSQARLRSACRSSRVSGTTGVNLAKGARTIGLATEIRDHAEFGHVARWLRKGRAGHRRLDEYGEGLFRPIRGRRPLLRRLRTEPQYNCP